MFYFSINNKTRTTQTQAEVTETKLSAVTKPLWSHAQTGVSRSWERSSKHRRLWGLSSMDTLFLILKEVVQTQAFMRAFIHGHIVPDPERGGANTGVYEGFHPRTHCSWSWKRWCKHRRLWGLSSTDTLFLILKEVVQTQAFMRAFIHGHIVPDPERGGANTGVYEGFHPRTGCSGSW